MSNSITYLGKTYTDDEIVSGSMSKRQSLNMAELPVDTAEITLRPHLHLGFFTHEQYPFFTRDGHRFKTSEENPLAGRFAQNTPLVQKINGTQSDIWYLQSVDRIGKDIYKLSGFSSLGRLTQTTHYGGIYNGITVSALVADICGNIPYTIEEPFRNISVYGWLPIATARDNLQQLLFAINAYLRTDESGVLNIQNISPDAAATIGENSIYQSNASVKYNTPVTKVVVIEHQYVVGSETKKLFDGTASGNQTITFDEPMSELSASSGLTIISSGANYAVVSGTGTLTGTPYVHMTREVSKEVSAESVENIVRVENATLVGVTAVTDVVNRLAAYYACRNTINVATTASFVGVGNVANVFDPYDEANRSAAIEQSNITLSATTKSNISALIGFAPPQTGSFEQVRVFITSDGVWENDVYTAGTGSYTFPDGVTSASIVLIDKGLNGGDGENGEAGTATKFSGRINRWNYSISGGAGTPGKGGVGGLGGKGGRIFRADITLGNTRTFAYAFGDTTTFGTLTSASGARLDYGYPDPINGVTYALPGADGIGGADGGRGGSSGSSAATTTAGEKGEDVPPYIGGSGADGYFAAIRDGGDYGMQSDGGAGGGGASANANGANASNYNHTGNGANGGQPPAKTVNGCGGDGGNGGGGSGAGGSWSLTNVYEGRTPSYITWEYDPYTIGTPGIGGAGGLGAPGCIIGYYRKPI